MEYPVQSSSSRDLACLAGVWTESAETGGAQPRVLLAVTAPLMRAAAEACLLEHGFAVRSSAVNAAAVIESAVRELPDIVLIDTDLPGGAITAATEVSSAVPGTAVVMLADAPTEADLLDAIYAGAVGCMPKHT